MNINLLKKLLPGEVDEFLVRNKVRSDGRELRHHRSYQISRSVLGQQEKGEESKALGGGSQAQEEVKASCAVRLGQTHILCSLVSKKQQATVL